MIRLIIHIITTAYLLSSSVVLAGDLTGQVQDQAHYYGVGWQNNGSHWSIDLELTKDGGKISYPSSGCAGQWSLIDERPEQLKYVEQILQGVENCIELGTVTIRGMRDGRLEYEWKEHSAIVVARAVLVPAKENSRLSYHDLMMLTLNNVAMDFLLPEFNK